MKWLEFLFPRAVYLLLPLRKGAGMSVSQHTPDPVAVAAQALWLVRREHEDRYDMELEDLRDDHPVWEEARAVVAALAPLVLPPEILDVEPLIEAVETQLSEAQARQRSHTEDGYTNLARDAQEEVIHYQDFLNVLHNAQGN